MANLKFNAVYVATDCDKIQTPLPLVETEIIGDLYASVALNTVFETSERRDIRF